ncbi:MAG TPA: hypothetical protein VKU36_05305 [Candidatus Babeliales bacterium]|nr:hypothetical protein [Candidatus Babeliales bacterium]
MKKNLLVIALSCITLNVLTLHTYEPNFEFYNKDKENGRVKITVNAGNRNIVTDKIVDPDEIYQAEIDPNANVNITVFTVYQKNRYFNIVNAPGKTKYLSWDSSKEPRPLYPQTGPLKGLMGRYNPFGKGRTETDLPLNNNISERNIVEQK